MNSEAIQSARPGEQQRPAHFLDRDGVINVEKNYVGRIEDFEFIDGIFDLVRAALACGLVPVVITNQAGIGRCNYSEEQFHQLMAWMREQFAAEGAPIEAVYYCPYHPGKGIGQYQKDSFDRKPNYGMILRARDELGLHLRRSFFVGDKLSDKQAGINTGIANNLLLSDRKANRAAIINWLLCFALLCFALLCFALLHEAIGVIQERLRCVHD